MLSFILKRIETKLKWKNKISKTELLYFGTKHQGSIKPGVVATD